MATIRKLKPINARRGEVATTYALPPGEYWIKSEDTTLGLRVTVGEGPHGLSVRIAPFVGTPKLTSIDDGDGSVVGCQYRQTPKAHAFARWYAGTATDDDVAMLGPDYRR